MMEELIKQLLESKNKKEFARQLLLAFRDLHHGFVTDGNLEKPVHVPANLHGMWLRSEVRGICHEFAFANIVDIANFTAEPFVKEALTVYFSEK